jgi:hypothetical protein
MNTFLEIPVDSMLQEMRREAFDLQRQINKTPKWRKVRRYRLFEKLYKLDEDRGLIAHVLNDDLGY